MSRLLTIIGYHSDEAEFGRNVREHYHNLHGSGRDILFYDLHPQFSVPAGQKSVNGNQEIRRIQNEFKPALTMSIHHTFLGLDLGNELSYSMRPLGIIDDFDLVWVESLSEKFERTSVDIHIVKDFPHSLYAHYCLEVEIQEIRTEYARNTAEMLQNLYLNYSMFRDRISSDEQFKESMVEINRQRQERIQRLCEKIAELKKGNRMRPENFVPWDQ